MIMISQFSHLLWFAAPNVLNLNCMLLEIRSLNSPESTGKTYFDGFSGQCQ
jgi:hypothetical protein